MDAGPRARHVSLAPGGTGRATIQLAEPASVALEQAATMRRLFEAAAAGWSETYYTAVISSTGRRADLSLPSRGPKIRKMTIDAQARLWYMGSANGRLGGSSSRAATQRDPPDRAPAVAGMRRDGMRLGITLWGFGLGYREAVDLARRAEDAGFHNLFMVESVLSNDGVTTAAMIAARTSRLLIGTNIANVYLRHPAMLAAAAVAIDEIAPERLVLGLGPNNRTMVTQAGFAWRDPREVLQATTATLRAVFAGEGVAGLRHPRPASHPIPIHWAGMALETCAAAGIHADGLMLYINTPARYRRAVERFRRAARAAGRDADRLPVSLLVPTFIHDDLVTARRAAREFLVHYARWPHYAKTFAASGYAAAMERVAAAYGAGELAAAMAALDDALLDEVVLLGPPARIREGIDRFARAGVEWITLGPQAVATDSLAQQAERMIALLAPR